MRFLHTADLHLGAIPDQGMPWSEERAQTLWDTFRRIIDTAGKQHVDLLLIAGDFFHRQPTTAECRMVDDLFARIPHTRVVIIAGDHDYIKETSPYIHAQWNSNVTILTSSALTSVYYEELNVEVHGLSYTQPEITDPLYDTITCPNDGRYHILLAHGGDETHIPIHIRQVADAHFDYVALGHLHSPQLSPTAAVAYCGSPEPIYPEDSGAHGYIIGSLDDRGCHYNWYPCSDVQYQTLNFSIGPDSTKDQIFETLTRSIDQENRNIYRIQLKGSRNIQTMFRLSDFQHVGRILDLKDETIPDLSLEQLNADHDHDLIAHFLKEADNTSDSMKPKVLYYGLRALLQTEE